MRLQGKSFKVIDNSKNGTVSPDTIMTFLSGDDLVKGEYHGGMVECGSVIAKRVSNIEFEMLYHAITKDAQIKAGKAQAVFQFNKDNQLTMHLDWEWLSGDSGVGVSQWRQI